jgi:CubicO group peptidase (beta-lactamase class C family)
MSKNLEQVSSQQFDQHMRALIEHRVAPSLAVITVRGSGIVVADGYGHPTLGKQAGASAETVYLYGSMTKLFTATAVMQLRERGLVELDRPVRDYVQDFLLRSASGREITVRHLLSHSSGIANPLGDSGGFHTEVRLYPQLDYGIAVFGNVTSYNTADVTNMIVTSYRYFVDTGRKGEVKRRGGESNDDRTQSGNSSSSSS